MKHLFIVNPVAGGKDRHEYVAEQARLALEGSADAYEVYITTAPMDACAKIKAEAASGEELRVYACGGDGTLNECVNGAVGHDNVAHLRVQWPVLRRRLQPHHRLPAR